MTRPYHVALLGVESRLWTLHVETAARSLPYHQIAERLDALARDVATLRRSMIESATQGATATCNTHNGGNNDAY